MGKRIITLAEYYNIPVEKFQELGILNINRQNKLKSLTIKLKVFNFMSR